MWRPVRLEEPEQSLGTDRSKAKVFRAHAPPNGAHENLMSALTGLQEQSRLKMLDELRKSITVVELKFSVDCPEAEIHGSGGRVDASKRWKNVGCALSWVPRTWKTTDGDHRWRDEETGTHPKPSLKASMERSGKECTTSMRTQTRQSTFVSTSRKAETLWKVREAHANGEAYYDQGSR